MIKCGQSSIYGFYNITEYFLFRNIQFQNEGGIKLEDSKRVTQKYFEKEIVYGRVVRNLLRVRTGSGICCF